MSILNSIDNCVFGIKNYITKKDWVFENLTIYLFDKEIKVNYMYSGIAIRKDQD